MHAQEGRHRRARRRYRAAAAIAGIAGIAVAMPAAAAAPAHAAAGGYQATAVISVGVGAAAMTQDMRTRTVWVANGEKGTVTEISERTRKAVAVIPVGASTSAIAADPRTGLVFAVNGGADYGQAGDAGSVSVISERLRKVVATITVGPSPAGVAVDSRSGTVYVSDSNAGAPGNFEGPPDGFVSVIGERSLKVTATIDAGGADPGSLAVGGGKVWVAYYGGSDGGGISVIGERAGKVTGGISPAPYRPAWVAADPSSREVWADGIIDNAGGAAPVTAVSEATGKAVASVPLPYTSDPGMMAVDPRAGILYAADWDALSASGEVLSVISEKTDTVTGVIPLTEGADGLAVDPCSGDVWVADGIAGTVTVISRV
jgi:YVTN family beta-propeller protein